MKDVTESERARENNKKQELWRQKKTSEISFKFWKQKIPTDLHKREVPEKK